MSKQYVYVASSWKNPLHTGVVAALRSANVPHYDFRHPEEGDDGFRWSEVGLSEAPLFDEYQKVLEHPVACHGFNNDYSALRAATHCVLVLPCGRSAHLELGYATATCKTAVLFPPDEPVVPELMYKLVDYMTDSLFDLLGWLGVRD